MQSIAQDSLVFQPHPNQPHFQDITNRKFGRLQVLGYAGTTQWHCQCKCGKIVIKKGWNLRKGITTSCGCFNREGTSKRCTTHGESSKHRTPEYRAWESAIQRCGNANDGKYKDYGGRGITVCDRWRNSYQHFLADMGRKPSAKHSLDRKNVNGDYDPANCRWATAGEQQRNKRNNYVLTVDGVTACLKDHCEKRGLNYSRTFARLRYENRSIEEIFQKK
jgi:hypothetical protein